MSVHILTHSPWTWSSFNFNSSIAWAIIIYHRGHIDLGKGKAVVVVNGDDGMVRVKEG